MGACGKGSKPKACLRLPGTPPHGIHPELGEWDNSSEPLLAPSGKQLKDANCLQRVSRTEKLCMPCELSLKEE